MRWFLGLSFAALAVAGACKKKTEDTEAEDKPPPVEVTDITLDLRTPTEATLTFRVLDRQKQPVLLDASRVEVTISGANGKLCEGLAVDLLDAAYGPDKRAKVDVEFALAPCDTPGELKDPSIEVRLKTPAFVATGSASPAKLVVPDPRPVPLPELDAELTKLGEALAPHAWAPPCHAGAVSAPAPVEAFDVSALAELTGVSPKEPAKGPRLGTATNLIYSIGGYRSRTVQDRQKLLERVRGIRYVVLLHANKLVQPERASAGTFKPGELEATGVLVDRTAGKALCMLRFSATSSVGVTTGGDPDALVHDFDGQILHALEAALTDVSPQLKLGAYHDLVH